jgi:hypothetical protein
MTKAKKGWGHGAGGTVPAWKRGGPEFKPQYLKKKKKRKKERKKTKTNKTIEIGPSQHICWV